ncbi:MAG: alpha/beta hydrolase [Anaerolineae bacterium]|nr:alpha/beta hydrolase [Anaerolineae bacterium]
MRFRTDFIFILTLLLAACGQATQPPPTPSPTPTMITFANPDMLAPDPAPFLDNYTFPQSINPEQNHLFYLHGKIIEDQGIPAISPEFGEYAYQAILEALASPGFVVISEQRAKDADAIAYAQRIAQQVTALLNAGVPAANITVVGASKGAWITVEASHLLGNPALKFVLLAVCSPEAVDAFRQDGVTLAGKVLSVYDTTDPYAGSCQKLFDFSKGRGLTDHDEIVLEVGSGHGILYQPLDEWVSPTIRWAGAP